MKSLKVLFFVALFTPWISRAEASPMKFQETVLVAKTQQLSGVDTASEGIVFLPLTINKDSIHNQGAIFVIAQAKRFPGSVNGRPVPEAVNVKRSPTSPISTVTVSKEVLENFTSAGDSFFLNFTNNKLFKTPFTTAQLGQIAFDTNIILVGNLETTTDPIFLEYDGKTLTFETFGAANTAMSSLIALTDFAEGNILLGINGATIEYGYKIPVPQK
jgi:hypothetical protein